MRGVLLFCLTLVLARIPLFAQSPISIEVGIHGGVPLKDTLEPAFCCTTGTAFSHVDANDASYLAGISAGVILYDRFHISFGGTYIPVSYRWTFLTCCPLTDTMVDHHGASWELPLVADYSWTRGSLRPFSGAGVIVHNVTSGGQNQSPGLVLSGGVELLNRGIVIRPEVRYIRYQEKLGSDVAVGRPQHQVEMLIGLVYRR